jgi:predicted nucleic-acid-binding protein
MEEMNDSKKHALMFLFTFIAAAVILGTVIFPFWNLIREDVYEEVEILLNERDKCYVDTSDNIPKTIDNCIHKIGDIVTIKYGKDLAYAEIVNP